MKVKYSLISAITIPLLLAAYMILMFRLHAEYRDYRVHLPLRCLHCAAISTGVSSKYRMPIPWYFVSGYQASSLPWWLRQINERRNIGAEGRYGNKNCSHSMVAFFMPHNENQMVLDNPSDYLLPARFHQVHSLASWLLILVFAVLPLQFASYWSIWRKGVSCASARTILWSTHICSLAAVTASLLFPVGTPITQRLDEYRRLVSKVKSTDGKTCDWGRIEYLLSDKAVHECEKYTIEFRYPDRRFCAPGEEACFLFPLNYLRQAQIQLALAAAPYNSQLVNRFFYGTPLDIASDWNTLTKRLDEQLIKRASAYTDWRMRGGPAEDRLDTVIAAHMHRELIVRTVSTNECGTVNVVWCGSELPKVEYLSLYGRMLSEGCSYWVPLRTVACKEWFPRGYLDMTQILMW